MCPCNLTKKNQWGQRVILEKSIFLVSFWKLRVKIDHYLYFLWCLPVEPFKFHVIYFKTKMLVPNQNCLKAFKCLILKLAKFRQILDFPITNLYVYLFLSTFSPFCKPLFGCMYYFLIPLYIYVILKLSSCSSFNHRNVVYLEVQSNFITRVKVFYSDLPKRLHARL